VALSATYKGPIDPRCDVFSVGCILFELLIGIPLFNANSREALLQVNLECAIDLKFLGGALGDLL
jgi:serine/threonine protein kinase